MKIKILISIFRGEGFFHSKIILKFKNLRFYSMDKLLTITLIFFPSKWVIRLEKIFCLVFEFYTCNHFMHFCTFLLLFSDRVLKFFFIYPLIYTSGEGNGTPLQRSCLENPMDGGAWQAAVHGIAKSRTWLSDWTEGFVVEQLFVFRCCFYQPMVTNQPWFDKTRLEIKAWVLSDSVRKLLE